MQAVPAHRTWATAILALALGGCGVSTEDRPQTADYVIEAILAPKCGRAACHSSVTKTNGYAFDTIPAALTAMKSTDHGQTLVVPSDPGKSKLVQVLTDSGKPMPPDAPLPKADIELITSWVAAGAEGLE